MGVRLVKHGVAADGGTYDHNKLENRDLPDQHPISSITGLQEALDDVKLNIADTDSIDLEFDKDTNTLTANIILNEEDTESIDLEYTEAGSVLKAYVKVFDSEDNAIQVKKTGLFVDKYPDIETEDTDSVHLYQEGKGETLLQMYQGGNVFSHNGGTNNIANSSEANAWYFDNSLGSFVQPQNTTTFTGFVSSIKYKTYTHRATLRSTDGDNDANGLVIAYVKDDTGRPHTLSCIINKGGESHAGSLYYALVYNKSLSGETIIKKGTMSSGHNTGGWNGNFITMEVSKAGSAVECSISNWGSYNINLGTAMSIDLDDYSWGYLFRDRVQYGYCNQSQAKSYFTDIYFSGKGPLKADVIISPDEDNGLEIRENGLYCGGGGHGSGSSNILKIKQNNHGFVPGYAVYLKSDGTYAKAFAEDSERIEVIGIVTEVKDANNFVITVSGEFQTNLYSSYANGTLLYLSDITSSVGMLIDEPTTYVKPVATKISGGILINIQRANAYTIDTDITLLYYTSDEIKDAVSELW